MPHAMTSTQNATEHRVIALATSLHNTLHNRLDILPAHAEELTVLLQRKIRISDTATESTVSDLAALGVRLWNAAAQIEAPQLDSLEQGSIFKAGLKVFAARLCNIQKVDVLLVLKAAQACVNERAADLALSCLEECSSLISTLQPDSTTQTRELVLTFYLLRIQHARMINNPDLAEHFAAKIRGEDLQIATDLCEKAIELCYGYGQQLLKTHPALALRWLDRAVDMLEIDQNTSCNEQLSKLRASTITTLVRLLLAGDEEAQERASKMTQRLYQRANTQIMPQVICLQIEVLLTAKPLQYDRLKDAAAQFATCELNMRSIRLIRAAIGMVDQCNNELALQITQVVLFTILDQEQTSADHTKMVGECLIVFTMTILKSSATPGEKAARLLQIYEHTSAKLDCSITLNAVQAIQSLLWTQQKVTTELLHVQAWLSLCQHRLLITCGNHNNKVIARRALEVALARKDAELAGQVFSDMRQNTDLDTIDQYLGYKTAVLINYQSLARSCLQAVAHGSPQDPSILYACASEAQSTAQRGFVIDALKAVLDNSPSNAVLLRCLTRLTLSIEPSEETIDQYLEEAASLLNALVTYLSKDAKRVLNGEECLWWSKTAYNLGIQYYSSSSSPHIVPILRACVQVTAYLLTIEPLRQNECGSRMRTCHFVLATRLITIARQDGSTDLFREVRHEITQYFLSLQAPEDSRGLQDGSTILRRYELEAVIRTQQWDELQQVIQQCLLLSEEFSTTGASGTAYSLQWDKLAELALIIHAELSEGSDAEWSKHAPDVLELLQRSINEIWKQEKNIANVARWLRTTFSIDQDLARSADRPIQVALKLLDQAAALASRGAAGDTERYPEEELQWLASMAFNRGVDHFLRDEAGAAMHLLDAALELARHADDNGALHACLTGKRAIVDKQAT